MNSLSETKVRPGNNWMRESYESNSKPLDLGATHSYFLKTMTEQRMTITEQCAEENRFTMTMLDMYNQIETNRK